jgi:hypothetical protein
VFGGLKGRLGAAKRVMLSLAERPPSVFADVLLAAAVGAGILKQASEDNERIWGD